MGNLRLVLLIYWFGFCAMGQVYSICRTTGQRSEGKEGGQMIFFLALFQAYIVFLYIASSPICFPLPDSWYFASLCNSWEDQGMRECIYFHKNWSINNFAALIVSLLVSADFIFPINANSIIIKMGKMKQGCKRFIVVQIPGFYQYFCVQ